MKLTGGRAAAAVAVAFGLLLPGLGAAQEDERPPEAREGRSAPLQATRTGSSIADGEVIVKWRTAPGRGRRNAMARAGARRARGLPVPRLQVLEVDEATDVDDAVAALEASPSVEYAEPNFVAELRARPNDPFFGSQWGLENTGQFVNGYSGHPGADIDAVEAWDRFTGDGSAIIAIVDGGVDIDHPNLAGNIWVNGAESNGQPGTDDDGNGYVDDVNGWDFVGKNNDPRTLEPHGSHVAGIAASTTDDATGTAGVAWDAQIMPLKVFDEVLGGGTAAEVVEAFTYAVDNGAHVVNASFGFTEEVQSVADAIQGAPDVLFVAAAANADDDTDQVPFDYPCTVPSDNVICVAASDQDDFRAAFSSWGRTTVDLFAPGESILSPVPPVVWAFYDDFENGLGAWRRGGRKESWGGVDAGFATLLSDSPPGNYANGMDAWIRPRGRILLPSGPEQCVATTFLATTTEYPFDALHWEASRDGNRWTSLRRDSGSTGGFLQPAGIRLDRFLEPADAGVHLRLRFESDDVVRRDGVYLFDFLVMCPAGYAGNIDDYQYLNGTSMATPHVSGAAALLKMAVPEATVAEIKAAILDGVDKDDDLEDLVVSGGRLNLARSLELLAGPEPSPSPEPEPSPTPTSSPEPSPTETASPEPSPSPSPTPSPEPEPELEECRDDPIAICGTNGPDEISVSGGRNNIYTGAGDDTINISGPGDNWVYAGAGDDTITISGRGVTVVYAGPGDDLVRVLGQGRVLVLGQGGADRVVVRGNARVTAYGGGGPDEIIFRRPGNLANYRPTAARGGPGRDRIIGDAGANVFFGDAGNDYLEGRGGPDELHGGKGADVLRGGPGHDRLFGGPGHDRLFGGKGNDLLNGGPGRDRCFPGPGRDTMRRCG